MKVNTWYRASKYVNTIVPVDVVKETKNYVHTFFGKVKKIGSLNSFFKTKKEAIQWLLNELERENEEYIEILKRYQQKLEINREEIDLLKSKYKI